MNCNPTLLQQSLDDRLTEAEEDSLSAHLSQCVPCQRELERLAGRPAAWTRVGSILKAACESGEAARSQIGFTRSVEADSAADFAVECLEPSSSAEYIGRLGDIEIQEVIGHGGMGVVLKGYQPELKRLVAVKVLAPQLAVSAAARKRFAREAQATAAILHPTVMPILTVHSSGKLPFIVMPYVACESLQQRLDRMGSLELIDILRIGMQTANGLAAAHAQGLVHRDVKPANILLEISVEKVMLTDFGLARAIDDASITRTGIIAGTPLYMSPEQARGEPVDARSDLFSLGTVLYTLATGRTPFRAESTYGILRRLTDESPRPLREISPQFPAWFEMIVHKLLAKSPADRFASATEIAQLLEGCLAHVQQPGMVPLPAECAVCIKPRRLQMSVGLLVVAILGVVGWWGLNDMLRHESAGDESRVGDTGNIEPPIGLHQRSQGDAEADWDAGEREVSPLRNDFEQWQKDAEKIWEEDPR
jgi:serine/threonine-protein kinase